MAPRSDTNEVIDKLKTYFFQPVMSLLVAILMYQIQEMRADIKQLLIQSNVDKTRIDDLERHLYSNNKKVNYYTSSLEPTFPIKQATFFKHEEEFDIKKYLRPTI